MKSEVYSWRVSTDLKERLEEEARLSGESVAAILERAASAWLEERRRRSAQDAEEQERIRQRALRFIGGVAGKDPDRAERARALVRAKLRGRRG